MPANKIGRLFVKEAGLISPAIWNSLLGHVCHSQDLHAVFSPEFSHGGLLRMTVALLVTKH
jgi:hypothetical protein